MYIISLPFDLLFGLCIVSSMFLGDCFSLVSSINTKWRKLNKMCENIPCCPPPRDDPSVKWSKKKNPTKSERRRKREIPKFWRAYGKWVMEEEENKKRLKGGETFVGVKIRGWHSLLAFIQGWSRPPLHFLVATFWFPLFRSFGLRIWPLNFLRGFVIFMAFLTMFFSSFGLLLTLVFPYSSETVCGLWVWWWMGLFDLGWASFSPTQSNPSTWKFFFLGQAYWLHFLDHNILT